MKAARTTTGLSGIVAVDKPSGMTSHDVVDHVRQISKERRVGHCGTLDPFATGLLLVCVGPATRLADHLSSQRKSYIARITFGAATDTDDAEGLIIERGPIGHELSSKEGAHAYLAGLVGVHEQMPPSYSSIKHKGVRAYEAARKGLDPHLAPRSIEVFCATLIDCIEEDASISWDVAFEVSKGTYIRALARDIAKDLGTCGHLSALRRTLSGHIGLALSHTLEAIASEGIEACFLDPVLVLGVPVFPLDEQQRDSVMNGRPLVYQHEAVLPPYPVEDGTIVQCTCDNTVLALYRYDAQQGELRALTVIPGGVRGPK